MRSPVSSFVLPLVLGLSACGPQNAVIVTGDYTAFMAASQSLTLRKGDIDLDAFDRRTVIDCREFADSNAEETEALRLSGRELVCPGDDGVGNSAWPPQHEIWLDQDGFQVFGADLEPWRGEAVITSEGDVQLGFHQRIPGGSDLRFTITVDPAFQPIQCEQNEAGDGTVANPLDGDWVENWTADWYASNAAGVEAAADETYFLNSYAYQFDTTSMSDDGTATPTFSIERWTLPNEWRAGYAAARLGDDDFEMRRVRYGEPEAYVADAVEDETAGIANSDLFLCTLPEGAAEDDNSCGAVFGPANTYGDMVSHVQDVADEVDDVLRTYGLPGKTEDGGEIEGRPSFRPVVERNRWRPRDEAPSGLDNWAGLNYAWVRFDEGSELEPGGAASGEFMVFFDGTENASRLVVRGAFDVKRFKKDTWTVPYLPDEKLEEYGTELCGGTTVSDEE